MAEEFKNEDNTEQQVQNQQYGGEQFSEQQVQNQQFDEQQFQHQQFAGQEMQSDGDMNYNYSNSDQYEKAKQQVEKERIKFEQKRAKAAGKREKKEAKKEAKKNKQSGGHGIFFKTVTLTVGAVAFGLIAVGTMYFAGDELGIYEKKDSKTTAVISKTSTTNSNDTEEVTSLVSSDSTNNKVIVTDVSKIVDDVMPSIVAITSTQLVQSGGYNDLYEYFFGYGGNDNSYSEQTGAGSGIIIGQNDSELLIVTNNHVVEDADSLTIQFIDDENVDAYVKGTSASNDLAVVAVKLSDIKESTLDAVKIATLGDSDALKVGEGTIAIGNALGYGQSVTTGVVSALDREVSYEDGEKNLIQTDAAINPGNSGGALLNMKGEVIGINAAKYSSSSIEGMGFAIPVSSVQDVIENLMNKETREKVSEDEKGYLNIYGRDVTDELSQMYDAPTGVLVVEVLDKGAAQKAGIEKSDIITAINGQEVSSMSELSSELEYYKKGEKVKLTIQYIKDKSYVEKEIEVTLGGEME